MQEISIKGSLEHIRLRPEMYIGSTYSPDHLLQEILDNSLDELTNGFANTITIDIPEDGHIIITDNGRGIPKEQIEFEGKWYDSIIAICTISNSGGKFDNNTYKTAIGLHGIGLTAVNALSKNLSITTRDRKNKVLFHHYEFQNGNYISYQSAEFKDINWSTRTEFITDSTYFNINKFNLDQIYERLNLVQAKYPHTSLFINNSKIEKITIEEYIRSLLNLTDDIPLFNINIDTSTCSIKSFLTYNFEDVAAPKIVGSVNLHLCGGLYLSNFSTAYINSINNTNLSKNDILMNFRAFVDVLVSSPSFDSQSKFNMTKNLSHIMTRLDFNKVASQPFIKESINKIIEIKTNKKASKATKRKEKVSALNPLKDCRQSPGKILYIMEGKSADGTMSDARDLDTEAVLPISGKILNAVKSTVDKAIDSKKFVFLLEAIGVQIGKNWSPRYEKFKILTDADLDGAHIAVLVEAAIWRYAPKIIMEKRLSLILPPLYGAIKNNIFIPIYDVNKISNYNNGYEIKRFKGIGEMTPSQIEVIIRNPIEYIILPPKDKREAEVILSVLTNVELKRKICEDKVNFNIFRLMKEI